MSHFKQNNTKTKLEQHFAWVVERIYFRNYDYNMTFNQKKKQKQFYININRHNTNVLENYFKKYIASVCVSSQVNNCVFRYKTRLNIIYTSKKKIFCNNSFNCSTIWHNWLRMLMIFHCFHEWKIPSGKIYQGL